MAPDLSVPGHPEVFVIGDLAHLEVDGQLIPGVAPAAIQGGQHAAKCLRADREGSPRPDFRYIDRGSMATIGRSRAVAVVGKLQLSGALAWLMWLFIHILFLIGFRSRVAVMFEWAWAWLTWERSARVVIGGVPPGQPLPAPPPDP